MSKKKFPGCTGPAHPKLPIAAQCRNKPRRHTEAVRQALKVVWEASDRICGKRLKAVLPVLVPALERHERLQLEPTVHAKLMGISAATIDRLLREVRTARSTRGTRSLMGTRRSVAARALEGWNDTGPGYMEVRLAGRAVQTLRLTDFYSGWSECVALQSGEQNEVVRCLDSLVAALPFGLRGLAFHGGLAFREILPTYCASRHIEVLQRRVGCRFDTVVPRVEDSARMEGASIARALSELYSVSRLYINVFSGTRSATQASALETPCSRLLLSSALSEHEKSQLRELAEALDPLQLLTDIRKLQTHIKILSAGFDLHTGNSQRRRWKGQETDRASKAAVRRYWRTHRNAFESAWPTIQAWRAADPNQTAEDLLKRLRCEQPGVYREGQLRSLQRHLMQWRSRTGEPRSGA